MIYDFFCENHVAISTYKKKRKEKKEKKQILGCRSQDSQVAISLYGNLILSRYCVAFLERRNREIEVGRAIVIKEVL